MNEMNVYSTSGEMQQTQNQGMGVAGAMMVSRQAQEVQAAMVIAKRFPRDEAASADRILKACMRKSLAESAMYEFPRGGQTITGPSIRLAEALAQNWGNLDYGIIELEQKGNESQVMAFAWDLETNTRQSKIFTVPHIRQTGKGAYPLTDPRDIYELVANQGARRMRSCILGVIPGDVVEMAVKQCEVTLRAGNREPLEARIAKMAGKFQTEFQITGEMLEGFIGKRLQAFSESDIVRLGKIYRSLKDGVIGSEYFTDRMRSSVAEPTPPAMPPVDEAVPEEDQLDLNDL